MSRLTLSQQLESLQQSYSALQAVNHELDSAQKKLTLYTAELQCKIDELYPLKDKAKEQADKIANLERQLKDKNDSYNYKAAELTKAESELEQAHAVLDGVDGAPSREYEKQLSYGGTSTCSRNVVTRLAGAFLAIAQKASIEVVR